MNTSIIIDFKHFCLAAIFAMLMFGCERDVDNLELASASTNPDVFIDGFSAGLNYAAFGGSVVTSFDVDKQETYNNSEAAMRFDVPNSGDPAGTYAGGVFFTETARDLSDYDVLTFWAKATQAATISEIGFGNDMGENKFVVSITNLKIGTNWKQYFIPIPDPSKLVAERGMFWYSAGNIDGNGFSFWIDEVKYENLGTIAYPQFAIFSGENKTQTSFAGVSTAVDGLISSFNLPTGINQAVNAAPAYFEFVSSNQEIATVNEFGNVAVIGGPGSAEITATMAGILATGSLTVQSMGVFQHAPTPSHQPANVVSVFSEAFTNTAVDYYNGYWAPYQTTQSADFEVQGDYILHYYDFNFVGIQISPINISDMNYLYLNIYLPNTLNSNAQFKIQVVDNAGGGTGVYTYTIQLAQAQTWITLDIPLANFAGLNSRTNIWQIIFEDVNNNISAFYADNIYFHQ